MLVRMMPSCDMLGSAAFSDTHDVAAPLVCVVLLDMPVGCHKDCRSSVTLA